MYKIIIGKISNNFTNEPHLKTDALEKRVQDLH